MLYATETQVQETGLSPDEAAQAGVDADAVYAQIETAPWQSDDDLHAWAQTSGALDAVRLNAALKLLRASGRVVGADLPAPTPKPKAKATRKKTPS